MSTEIENEIKKLRNLVNYKDSSDEELLKIAKINLTVKEFKNSPSFFYDGTDEKIKTKLKEELNFVVDRFKNYLIEYKVDGLSDIDTLKSLVFLELLELRLQKEINKDTLTGTFASPKITDQLLGFQDQIAKLKLKLGIDKAEVKDSELTVLEDLEERFQEHYEANTAEFDLSIPQICPKCGYEHVFHHLMRKRVKDFDSIKHPFFLGKWFVNLPVIKFVKEGILTKAQAAEILSNASDNDPSLQAFTVEYCSDMIDYVLEHYAEIMTNKV